MRQSDHPGVAAPGRRPGCCAARRIRGRPGARCLRAILPLAILAGCAPMPRHHCVEVPNGLVECTEVPPPATAAR
jgi:hypothetical protein